MKNWPNLPIELKHLVVRFAPLSSAYVLARTCRENYSICISEIFRGSDLSASTALSLAIREEVAKEKAAKREPDKASATNHETNYILRYNHRALQLCHFWLAVEIGSCSMVSRLAKEANIRQEWEEFRNLDLASGGLEAFNNLMMLAMKAPRDIANDLLGALLHLLKIDSSCHDEEGVKRLRESLNIACQHGKLQLVEELVAHGADPRKSFGGRWPLTEACKSGSEELFGFLLLKGASINVHHESTFHIDILVAAIEGNNVHIVQHLLDNRAFMDNMGNTINCHGNKLLSAVSKICVRDEIREMLKERLHLEALGTTDGIKTYNGVLAESPTPTIQLNENTVDVARARLDDMMRNPQVELSIIQDRLDEGANPNPSTTHDTRSPLAQACYHGRKDIAEVLFHHGAIIEADEYDTAPANPQAQTTLQAAVAGGHVEMLEWLLDRKAVIHNKRVGRDSWHSLCQAAIQGGILMLKFLLGERDAFLRLHGDYLSRQHIEVILQEAVNVDRVEIVQYLIEWFDFTKADVNRLRLLHKARLGRRMMKTLQNYGADINAVDEKGSTVLHHAATESNELAVAFLLCRGADTTIRDGRKRKAIDHARESEAILKLLKNHDKKRQPKRVGLNGDA